MSTVQFLTDKLGTQQVRIWLVTGV